MSRKNKKKIIKNSKKDKVLSMCSIIIILVFAILYEIYQQNYYNNGNNQNETNTIIIGSGDRFSEKNLYVYYIDVGQADSILIINNKESALIDAGNNDDGEEVVEFIKARGIEKLDYVIGTHPHEDHIGGLDDVIDNFDVGKIYLPKIQTTTKNYQDVLNSIQNKNKKISSLSKGDRFNIGDAQVEVMTDSILDKSNLNLASNILRMEFKSTSFLFTGDAETENEKTTEWKKVDILKVGHHGSTTSSSKTFLNQIKPQYAIISVGKDNDYGHPKDEILKRLNNIGTKIYRTDENGTIEVIVTQ